MFDIKKLIKNSFVETNHSFIIDELTNKTSIFGDKGTLVWLSLMTFLISLEQKIEEELEKIF